MWCFLFLSLKDNWTNNQSACDIRRYDRNVDCRWQSATIYKYTMYVREYSAHFLYEEIKFIELRRSVNCNVIHFNNGYIKSVLRHFVKNRWSYMCARLRSSSHSADDGCRGCMRNGMCGYWRNVASSFWRFPHYWPFARESTAHSHRKGQWYGTLIVLTWTNCWTNSVLLTFEMLLSARDTSVMNVSVFIWSCYSIDNKRLYKSFTCWLLSKKDWIQ